MRSGFYPVDDDPEELYGRAVKLAEVADVWVSMCVRRTRSGRADAACRCNVLWADCDHGRERLEGLEWRPSLVVESSYTPRGCPEPRQTRWQAFWALAEPADLADAKERAELVAALRGVQTATGSDPVSDLARVMRVPGTLNWKHGDEPNLIRPVEFRPEGVLV